MASNADKRLENYVSLRNVHETVVSQELQLNRILRMLGQEEVNTFCRYCTRPIGDGDHRHLREFDRFSNVYRLSGSDAYRRYRILDQNEDNSHSITHNGKVSRRRSTSCVRRQAKSPIRPTTLGSYDVLVKEEKAVSERQKHLIHSVSSTDETNYPTISKSRRCTTQERIVSLSLPQTTIEKLVEATSAIKSRRTESVPTISPQTKQTLKSLLYDEDQMNGSDVSEMAQARGSRSGISIKQKEDASHGETPENWSVITTNDSEVGHQSKPNDNQINSVYENTNLKSVNTYTETEGNNTRRKLSLRNSIDDTEKLPQEVEDAGFTNDQNKEMSSYGNRSETSADSGEKKSLMQHSTFQSEEDSNDQLLKNVLNDKKLDAPKYETFNSKQESSSIHDETLDGPQHFTDTEKELTNKSTAAYLASTIKDKSSPTHNNTLQLHLSSEIKQDTENLNSLPATPNVSHDSVEVSKNSMQKPTGKGKSKFGSSVTDVKPPGEEQKLPLKTEDDSESPSKKNRVVDAEKTFSQEVHSKTVNINDVPLKDTSYPSTDVLLPVYIKPTVKTLSRESVELIWKLPDYGTSKASMYDIEKKEQQKGVWEKVNSVSALLGAIRVDGLINSGHCDFRLRSSSLLSNDNQEKLDQGSEPLTTFGTYVKSDEEKQWNKVGKTDTTHLSTTVDNSNDNTSNDNSNLSPTTDVQLKLENQSNDLLVDSLLLLKKIDETLELVVNGVMRAAANHQTIEEPVNASLNKALKSVFSGKNFVKAELNDFETLELSNKLQLFHGSKQLTLKELQLDETSTISKKYGEIIIHNYHHQQSNVDVREENGDTKIQNMDGDLIIRNVENNILLSNDKIGSHLSMNIVGQAFISGLQGVLVARNFKGIIVIKNVISG